MNEKDRAFLKAEINKLSAPERALLLKRAAQLRKSSPRTTRPAVRTASVLVDEDDALIDPRRRATTPLDDFVLRILREDARLADEDATSHPVGEILSLHKGRCDVLYEGRWIKALLSSELTKAQQNEIAVGDRVWLTQMGRDWRVTRVLARTTKLSRPDPGQPNRERVIVANVDTIVVVAAVVSPPFHPRLIDRYLVAINRGGARPVIAINKIDLLENNEEIEGLAGFAALGVPILRCSVADGRGIPDLLQELKGQTSAFVGHSGVGKSSLVKAICPTLRLEVGDVSAGNLKGAHTTRRSTLYDLGEATRVIDTPGIRSFGLWDLDRDELAWSFPEFHEISCKFRNCSHTHEPGCGVRQAVDEGRISPDRYDAYIRMQEGLV